MHNIERLEEALTSKKWKFEFLEQSACPEDVASFFKSYLAHLSSDSFLERLKLGGFYINGISTYDNVKLNVPCKVEYYEPKFDLADIQSVYPAFSKDWIVYEDEYVLVVFKPKRLPCLPTKEQKLFNLKNYIEGYCSESVHMPSRLDTSTQGLVILSKHAMMHNYLQQAFEKRIITKRYLLASSEKAAWKFKALRALIGKNKSHPILRKITDSDGKESFTIFTSLADQDGTYYYLARPLTGRTHQIRVHASHLGIPILGDNFYGGKRAECLHLMSYQLALWHPYKKFYLDLTVPRHLLSEWALPAVS